MTIGTGILCVYRISKVLSGTRRRMAILNETTEEMYTPESYKPELGRKAQDTSSRLFFSILHIQERLCRQKVSSVYRDRRIPHLDSHYTQPTTT